MPKSAEPQQVLKAVLKMKKIAKFFLLNEVQDDKPNKRLTELDGVLVRSRT